LTGGGCSGTGGIGIKPHGRRRRCPQKEVPDARRWRLHTYHALHDVRRLRLLRGLARRGRERGMRWETATAVRTGVAVVLRVAMPEVDIGD